MSRTWKCGLCCGAFICLLLSELLTHFYVTHKNDEGFHIKCGINGCQNSYRNELSEVDINFELILSLIMKEFVSPSSISFAYFNNIKRLYRGCPEELSTL